MKTRGEGGPLQARQEASEGNKAANTLTLDSQPPEL